MGSVRRVLVAVLALFVLAAPAAAGGGRSERPPTRAELQRAANRAAARFAAAQAVFERLDTRIGKLDRKIAAIQAGIVPLRASVTRRTTAIYRGTRTIDVLVPEAVANDPVDSARATRFVALANRADHQVIQSLNESVSELRSQQRILADSKSAQQASLDQLLAERRGVEAKLAEMAEAERLAKAERANAARRAVRPRRARVLGAAAGPQRPGAGAEPQRPGAGAEPQRPGAGAAVAGPSTIPVAANFICPIDGPLAFTDSWGDPRSGGRRHKGVDLMSPRGSNNVAVTSGDIERQHSGAGGLSLYLYGDDGTVYYYAHLNDVMGPDRRVAQGEVIGHTGSTGNARGGSPHTHFEIHPGGGAAVNPYPTVKAVC